MEEALRSLLLGTGGVAALVGDGVEWGARTQGAPLPRLVLKRVGAPRSYTLGGEATLRETRVQADCWARHYDEALALARLLGGTLSGLSGEHHGHQFDGIFIDGERDLPDSDGEPVHRTSLDLRVWHHEP